MCKGTWTCMFKAMLLEITNKKITNDDSNNDRDIIWVSIRKRMIKGNILLHWSIWSIYVTSKTMLGLKKNCYTIINIVLKHLGIVKHAEQHIGTRNIKILMWERKGGLKTKNTKQYILFLPPHRPTKKEEENMTKCFNLTKLGGKPKGICYNVLCISLYD